MDRTIDRDFTAATSVDSFANPNSDVRTATQALIVGATDTKEKLRKIYAAVMALENTDFTREREKSEDKAESAGKIKNAADVLSHKRGNSRQLAELFISMARPAGIRAYAMYLPSRNETVFAEGWLNLNQFDDIVAVVNVDGKEVFLDPGARYVPYGQLGWDHTFVRGLRQTADGTAFATTDGPYYVTGTLGTPTGKRLVLPADLFMAKSTATFPHEKRVRAVYFHYPELVQDVLRINFKKGFTLEAVPKSAKWTSPLGEMYELTVAKDETSFTTRRNHAQDEIVVKSKDYGTLRSFYAQYESKDQESVVLKVAPAATAGGGSNQ